MNELRTENEELREDHDALKDEFRAYRKAVRTKFERIEETQEIHDSRLDAVADGIDRVEAQSSDAESGGQTEEPTVQRRETPLERLLDDPASSGIRVTASVTRALDLVSHFEQWSKSVPAGNVIRDGFRTLLSTVEGEQLAWKQVYRAAHKLHELTNGQIEFKKTSRYGWILVLEDPDYLTRVVSAGNRG